MSFTVYDGIEAFAKRALLGYYNACKTAIFNDPKNQVLTPKGRVTKVREIESGMAGNYDKSKGWMRTYGTGQGVKWVEYRAEHDRAKVLFTDAIDEEQSFANGMTPSIDLLNTDFLDNQLPREVDASNIAKWASRVPSANILVDGGMGGNYINANVILETLNDLDSQIFSSGYEGDTVLFMNPTAYKNFITAIQNKWGLASNVLMEKVATVYLDTGVGEDSAIKVNITFEQYGHFLIVRTPADRMYTKIIMLSGDPDDDGQEMGGYIPDYLAPDFANIYMLAVPINAAFANMRYMVDNLLVPAYMDVSKYTKVDLRLLNQKMFGNVEINNAGINQKANGFEYDVRAIYGGDIFSNRRKSCFMVTDNGGATTPDIVVNDNVGKTTDLLGKTVDDLQSNVVVDEEHGIITGTLKYVTGYTGFSENVSEQSGNYLALKIVPSEQPIGNITATVKNENVVDTEDHTIVLRITDTLDDLVVSGTFVSGYGTKTITKRFKLSGLTLALS